MFVFKESTMYVFCIKSSTSSVIFFAVIQLLRVFRIQHITLSVILEKQNHIHVDCLLFDNIINNYFVCLLMLLRMFEFGYGGHASCIDTSILRIFRMLLAATALLRTGLVLPGTTGY